MSFADEVNKIHSAPNKPIPADLDAIANEIVAAVKERFRDPIRSPKVVEKGFFEKKHYVVYVSCFINGIHGSAGQSTCTQIDYDSIDATFANKRDFDIVYRKIRQLCANDGMVIKSSTDVVCTSIEFYIPKK